MFRLLLFHRVTDNKIRIEGPVTIIIWIFDQLQKIFRSSVTSQMRILMQGSQLYRQCFTQVRIIISDDGNVIWYPESGSSQQAVQINCRGIIETKERRCVSGKFEQLLIFRIKEDGIFVLVCKPEYSTGTGRQSSTVDSVYKSGVSHASRVFFTIHKADKRSMSTSYEVFSCQFSSLVIIGYNTWNIDK